MQDAAQTQLAQALGFQPGFVLRTFGMRRSGNHAIINWLTRNREKNSVFLNNCVIGKPAATSCRGIEINNRRLPHKQGDSLVDTTFAAGDGALVVISYEDFAPDTDDLVAGLTSDIPEEMITRNILMYRNFMNWAASLLHKVQSNDAQQPLDCLRIMMSAMDKYRDLLDLVANAKSVGALPINYDRWVARPRYRGRLLDELGLPRNDNSLGPVQPYGGGSSFQRDAQRAEELATDQRWREMINDPSFQIVLLAASQDDELIALMHKLMPQDAEMLTTYLGQAQFPYHVQVTDT